MRPALFNWTSRIATPLRLIGSYGALALLPGGTLIALIVWGIRHRSWLSAHASTLVAFALLAASPLALADAAHIGPAAPAAPSPTARSGCQVSDKSQARSLADELYQQHAYERASECYRAAGEYNLAHLASLNAVGPESASTANALRQNRDAAKTQVHRLQQAVRRSL